MSQDTAIYDLGAVDAPATSTTRARAAAAMRRGEWGADRHRPVDAIADSLGLFVPGAGQLLRGHWADGLFVLSSSVFLISLGWAVLASLERLPENLSALGVAPHAGLYALGVVYVALAWIHAGNLLYGTSRGPNRTPPALAGCASALIPGWGQLLTRQPIKASMFVAGLWCVGLVWLLGSPWVGGLLDSQGVALRDGARILSSPALLWTVPVVLWVLSVYDAVATARR